MPVGSFVCKLRESTYVLTAEGFVAVPGHSTYPGVGLACLTRRPDRDHPWNDRRRKTGSARKVSEAEAREALAKAREAGDIGDEPPIMPADYAHAHIKPLHNGGQRALADMHGDLLLRQF
jgi:hypothetical protein